MLSGHQGSPVLSPTAPSPGVRISAFHFLTYSASQKSECANFVSSKYTDWSKLGPPTKLQRHPLLKNRIAAFTYIRLRTRSKVFLLSAQHHCVPFLFAFHQSGVWWRGRHSRRVANIPTVSVLYLKWNNRSCGFVNLLSSCLF